MDVTAIERELAEKRAELKRLQAIPSSSLSSTLLVVIRAGTFVLGLAIGLTYVYIDHRPQTTVLPCEHPF